MQQAAARTSGSKPALLALAISFALTACGGSGNDNHTAPEQPQTPSAPESSPTPPAADNTPAPKTPNTPAPKTPGKPSAPGNNDNIPAPAPEAPPSPQNPKDGPKLPTQETPVPQAKFYGPAFFNIGQKAVVYNIFSNSVKESYDVKKDTFGLRTRKLNLLAVLDDKLGGYQAQNGITLSKGTHEATIEMSKGSDKIQAKLNYTGEAFGYEKAQAFHFYGKISHPFDQSGRPFDAAYTIGTLAPTKAIDAMQGEILYKGYASFRAYQNPADKLATGTAALTLDMTKKAITNATIDLQDSIGKTYTFASAEKPVSILKDDGKTNNSFMTGKFTRGDRSPLRADHRPDRRRRLPARGTRRPHPDLSA